MRSLISSFSHHVLRVRIYPSFLLQNPSENTPSPPCKEQPAFKNPFTLLLGMSQSRKVLLVTPFAVQAVSPCCSGHTRVAQSREGSMGVRGSCAEQHWGGPEAKAQCQQLLMQLKTHVTISLSMFSRCTVRINMYSGGVKTIIKTKNEGNLHPCYKLQMTSHF